MHGKTSRLFKRIALRQQARLHRSNRPTHICWFWSVRSEKTLGHTSYELKQQSDSIPTAVQFLQRVTRLCGPERLAIDPRCVDHEVDDVPGLLSGDAWATSRPLIFSISKTICNLHRTMNLNATGLMPFERKVDATWVTKAFRQNDTGQSVLMQVIGRVHRAVANSIDFKTRATRGSVCNPLLSSICAPSVTPPRFPARSTGCPMIGNTLEWLPDP